VVAPDCAGFDFLHLLRHDAHIGRAIAALVAEAIKFETVVEPHQRDDAFLKADVGTTPTAAPATAAMTHMMTALVMPTGMMAHVVTSLMMRSVVRLMMHSVVRLMMHSVVRLMMHSVVRHVVTDVAMPMPMPTMPAVASTPPAARDPRTICAYVPARSVPAAVVPAVTITIPNVLHAPNQFQTVGRGADSIGGANWRRLCAAMHQRASGYQRRGEHSEA